jgi:hypothetical protein
MPSETVGDGKQPESADLLSENCILILLPPAPFAKGVKADYRLFLTSHAVNTYVVLWRHLNISIRSVCFEESRKEKGME